MRRLSPFRTTGVRSLRYQGELVNYASVGKLGQKAIDAYVPRS